MDDETSKQNNETTPVDDDDEDVDDIFASTVTHHPKASVDISRTPPVMTAAAGHLLPSGHDDDIFAGIRAKYNDRPLFNLDTQDDEEIDLNAQMPVGQLRLSTPPELLEDETSTRPTPPPTASKPPTAVPLFDSAPTILPTSVINPFASTLAPYESLSPFRSTTSSVLKVSDELDDGNADSLAASALDQHLDLSIAEYEKRGDGMNAYIVFKIITKVMPSSTVPGYTKKHYEVWRRFSDFLGLHEKLHSKHLPNGVIVPPPPEKSVVGMTKAKMSKTVDDDHGTSEFLERRRSSLQRFIRRVALHSTLISDCDMRDFLTMDTELPKSGSTAALSSAGVKRMMRVVGDAFTKMAYHMDENDRWFEETRNEMDDLDANFRKLHEQVESLVMLRRELASGTDGFCKSLSMLASCEESTALARAFSHLAETQEKVALLEHDQADKDLYILSETLREYLALLESVKEVFYERIKVWQGWQTAQQNLTKKRELKTRYELTGKMDKINQAKTDVIDAEKKVEEMEDNFVKISKQIRKEIGRFRAQRIIDIKSTIIQYLESLAIFQQQLVKYWEAFVPEARAIIN